MSKTEDLSKINQTIKDSEVRLRTFKANIDAIQKELDFLNSAEKQLETNIRQLKKIKVAVIATEYRKAKEDLKKTKNRLLQLKSDKIINDKAYKDTSDFIDKNKELYVKSSKQNENNVLQGKFGKDRE